ncbi:hypothetical protein LCGC14_2028000, partial [marine sediment metagenome]
SIAIMKSKVEAFNKRNPVGTSVTVIKDLGEPIETKVRYPAEILSGHTPVVWLVDISGCYLLDRVIAGQNYRRHTMFISMFCRFPGCAKEPQMNVSHVQGIVRHTIEVCMDHGKWAESYLEDFLEEKKSEPEKQ